MQRLQQALETAQNRIVNEKRKYRELKNQHKVTLDCLDFSKKIIHELSITNGGLSKELVTLKQNKDDSTGQDIQENGRVRSGEAFIGKL